MIRFQALGGLAVTGEEGEALHLGGPRQRRLVAMLLIHHDSVVSVDRLADAVFAGEPTPSASTTLRSYVARFRRVLNGADAGPRLVTQAPGYVLQLPGEALDVVRFERMVARAGSRLEADDPAEASALLRESLGLWRGDAYAEFADEDWARPEAQRLAELRLVAQERLVEAELACGRATQVIPVIESLVAEHPLREGLRAQLMLALYRAGRQADSLAAYRRYREELVEELGIEPSPALARLEQRVLAQDPTLLLAEPAGHPLRGYRLGERLGSGRDGTVYAARLPGVDRDFAVRVFRAQIADDPEFVRSFEATAHRLASLRHPGVVPIHDYWREPGAAYLVMRRMHGGSLADRLEHGPLTAAATATLVERIGGALVAAAESGIVHGRLGPRSVLFDASGDPYLSDFTLGQPLAAGVTTDDVPDFAALVGACLPDRHAVSEVLAPGAAAVGRPSMAEFAPMVVSAVTGLTPALGHETPNPYKGLLAFEEADAADFFGRSDLVQEMIQRLGREGTDGRLLLVVGGSGTGKSSAVRAGLLPRVRRGDVPGSRHWFVTTMLPGTAPFNALAESLRRVAVADAPQLPDRLAADRGGIDRTLRELVAGGGQLLLVIDQLEELFTLATEADQRAFLDGLMHALLLPDSRLRVVATLRADFYDRPLTFPSLSAAVSRATVPMVPMSPADLEAAIVEPVERVGGRVEPALVAELVTAVARDAAALPALQFTLFELAELSPTRQLRLAAYRELGGIGGAIASRAERLYSAITEEEQVAVRRMFDRLVHVGPETEPSRRRAARSELTGPGTPPSVDAMVDRWARARLLTLDRHPQNRAPTVEVAHEALLREWPRLRGWIEEDRAALMALGNLRESAATWMELDRDPGALYRGARLEILLAIAESRLADLPEPEHEFLQASREARDRERREEAERLSRQARANRRLRIQLATIAAALVLALVGGFVAVDQRRQALGERRIATARELAAAADATLADDPELSMLLALAAVDETRAGGGTALREAVEALHAAVSESRALLRVPSVGGAVDWSPDGTLFVTEGPEESGIIDLRDAATGDSVLSFRGHADDVNDVAFSPDGSLLATTGDDGTLRVWSTETGEESLVVTDAGRGNQRDVAVRGPSFSPDGTRVAAAWPASVRVVDVRTGDTVTRIPTEGPSSTAFSPDGSRVTFGSFGSAVMVADAATGKTLRKLPGDDDALDVDWSSDGRWIAAAGSDATVRVWDALSGEARFTITDHTDLVWEVDWSPDGTRLASASDDGTALVTEIRTDGTRRLFSFSARDASRGVGGLSFSPDGERLMTGNAAITAVTVWDASATGGGEWVNLWGRGDFMPDSRRLVVADGRPTVQVIDVRSGRRMARVKPGGSDGPAHVFENDVSRDGQLVLSTGSEGLTVWDAASGERRFAVAERGVDWVWDTDWSRDGDHLATANAVAGGPGEVVVVDRAGTEVARLPESEGFHPRALSFSPDGRRLATTRQGVATIDPTKMPVTVWDWRDGSVVWRQADASAELVEYDPQGRLVATSRVVEGVVDLWDAHTGERRTTLTSASHIADLAFAESGSTLATAHADGTIRLWDTETGEERLALRTGGTGVQDVVFSPDGSVLVSADGENLLRVWALDLDDLIGIAEDRLTRGFRDDECRRYLHLNSCPDA